MAQQGVSTLSVNSRNDVAAAAKVINVRTRRRLHETRLLQVRREHLRVDPPANRAKSHGNWQGIPASNPRDMGNEPVLCKSIALLEDPLDKVAVKRRTLARSRAMQIQS